jgi:aspartyl-tRNA(Asn)/glutamyl-tRNA(Gln) amidotransferase subunit B
LRSKEYAHDYRYFPEPDLVPLAPTPELIDSLREQLPELPGARRDRYAVELGLSEDDAAQLAFDAELGAFFERAVGAAEEADPRAVATWVTGELVREARATEAGHPASTEADPAAVARLADLVAANTINRKTGRELIGRLVREGGDPAAIVEAEGLGQVSDGGELEAAVERAIEAEPEAAQKIRDGQMKAIGALVGAVMRETQGRADGGEVTRLIREKLSG